MPLLRIDKIISGAGLASRSEVKRLIRQGRVHVDGVTVLSPADKYDTDADIRIDDTPVRYRRFVYLMMNKPAGYLSATEDRTAPTVLDLLDSRYAKMGLFPAGRLDKDSEGFLLLTNDGEFCHRVISPKSGIKKEYFIRIDGSFDPDAADRFAGGIVLEDGTQCRPAELRVHDGGAAATVTVCEGMYHQVKRMAAAAGARVTYLRRVSIGGVPLDENLGFGQYREFSREELGKICSVL